MLEYVYPTEVAGESISIMAESVSSRITRLQQLLSGRSGRKVPLLDKDALLDSMVCLYSECSSDVMMRDKNIATFIKKCKYFTPSPT